MPPLVHGLNEPVKAGGSAEALRVCLVMTCNDLEVVTARVRAPALWFVIARPPEKCWLHWSGPRRQSIGFDPAQSTPPRLAPPHRTTARKRWKKKRMNLARGQRFILVC